MTGAAFRLLATDIDGTMLRPDGTLSPRVEAALHAAVAAGVHVVPATGRPYHVALDVIEWLNIRDYWIFANGAVTRHLDRGDLVRGFWMDPTVAQGLIVELREDLPGAGFAVELEDEVVYEPGFELVVPQQPPFPSVDDVLDHFRGRVQKVLVFDPGHDVDRLFDRVRASVGDHAVATYSGLPFVEVSARLVTKATALELLCADLGIDRSQVVSVGDNHNDITMLEWAGRSFAMGNATDDAKAAAGAVLPTSDEDGLAVLVEDLLGSLT
jgi:Cof subfamily protein (haloacid dehalogenase superfamily)